MAGSVRIPVYVPPEMAQQLEDLDVAASQFLREAGGAALEASGSDDRDELARAAEARVQSVADQATEADR